MEGVVRTGARLGWVAEQTEGDKVDISSVDIYRDTGLGRRTEAGQQLLQGRGGDRDVWSSLRLLVL